MSASVAETRESDVSGQSAGFYQDIPLPEMGSAASGKQWMLRPADARAVATIIQRHELSPQLARVLSARGVSSDEAHVYLNPSLREFMPDPYVLKDMQPAAKRITDAIIAGEGVGVFGDYDVDGTTAAAILKLYFNAIGAPLDIYLPDRITEGYGPSSDAFMALHDRGAGVIITVDCGAAAHEPVAAAAARGVSVVVLDHHLMDGPPPEGAAAVVNPNRPDDLSGLTNLSAAGVAFMTMAAVNRNLRERGYFVSRPEPKLTQLLDLAALGLVCDVMDMKGLTRVIVAQGLKLMRAGGNEGLAALGRRAGVKGNPSTYHLGFLLGPRINAAGRIGHARLAFELMTTDDAPRRQTLAEKLHVMNAERQAIEADVQADALRRIEREKLDTDDFIVVAGDGWHPGVIGIVAGRLKEKFDRPVIVIGLDGDTGKGSGRSLTGVDLGGAVSSARAAGFLISGGGHAMAAGLTIAREQIEPLRAYLNNALQDDIAAARAARTLKIDGVVSATSVTRTFMTMIDQAGPYGPGNPEPVFAVCALEVIECRIVGENHLSVTARSGSGDTLRAIAFRAAGEPLEDVLRSGERVHIAGKIRADDWRGGDAAQLHIVDAAPAR
ncbi:MAG: single-stranded-DNA-specific exonuclease RecJ [Pseudomonadota bacterium]